MLIYTIKCVETIFFDIRVTLRLSVFDISRVDSSSLVR